MRKPRSKMCMCWGGPYDGIKLLLTDTGTLEFKIGKFKGYYDQQMKWVNTNG